MHHSKEVDENTKKPTVILFYNATKGGTDTFDQLCHSYSVTRNTNRWPMRVWFGMMDQSGINAMVLYNLKEGNKKMKRREFLKDLSLSLVKPFLQSRLDRGNLRRSLRVMICSILGIALQEERPVAPGERKMRRCSICPRSRDKKTKHVCTSCRRPICDDHRVEICCECID